jgi:hypothetical protein
MNPLTQFKIFKKILILPVLIPLIFACFALSPTAQAITDAKAEDTHNKYKNVGTFIVIRGPNPIGLPPDIAATVTAVLIHERVLLSAGHFVARAYNNGNGIPFFTRVVVSFSPNALDESTWIDIKGLRARMSRTRRSRCHARPRIVPSTIPMAYPNRVLPTSG